MIDTGKMYSGSTDTNIYINKVFFRSPQYIKAKITLYYKDGTMCEDRKTYLLCRKRIGHWHEVY